MKKQDMKNLDEDSELAILKEIVERMEELQTGELDRVMAYLNSRYAAFTPQPKLKS